MRYFPLPHDGVSWFLLITCLACLSLVPLGLFGLLLDSFCVWWSKREERRKEKFIKNFQRVLYDTWGIVPGKKLEGLEPLSVPFKFWTCPICPSPQIAWKDDLATCESCGRTNKDSQPYIKVCDSELG